MDRIYKTKFGFHIDLSKILMISEIVQGNGYYSVYFEICFQLMDNSLNKGFYSPDPLDEKNNAYMEYVSAYNDLLNAWKEYAKNEGV